MLLPSLALKNLARNRRRTLLTTISVVAGVGIFILGEGFVGGMEENIISAAVDGTVGHVLARPADYPAQGFQAPVDKLLDISPAARALLDREATSWTERTLFAPIAASHADNLRVLGIGYDPVRDPQVFPRRLWKIDGSFPRPDGDEVAVSPGVARLLSLRPGDNLVLQVRTHPGAINALDVKVSAIVSTNNAAQDGLGIWVPQALTRRLIAADAPTHLAVKLARREDADAFAPRLLATLGSQAEVVTWRSETAELLRLQEIRRRSLDVIVFILMTLAAFSIANTVLMAAYERVREVGTLRALGMTEGRVLRLFLLEGALMGLVGGVLGALWGGGLVTWWGRHPIDFSSVLQRQTRISLSAYVYTQFDPTIVAGAVAMGVLAAALASLYPARVASRMAPADAVRAP